MSHVVTATHPVTLGDGRPVAPGDKVAYLKTSDPHNADLIEQGLLAQVIKKKAATPKNTEAVPPVEEESK